MLYKTSHRRPVRSVRPTKRWYYQGKPVFVVPTAEIAPEFRPDHQYGFIIQQILDGLQEWEPGDDPIETGHSDELALPAIVTRNSGRRPVWGVYVGHTARRPQLSPFIHGSGEIETTNSLTIELAGTPNYPRLTRVYPGEYTPPLPWQESAADADGGKEYCLEFWKENSYIYDRSLIIRGTQTNTVPEWYR